MEADLGAQSSLIFTGGQSLGKVLLSMSVVCFKYPGTCPTRFPLFECFFAVLENHFQPSVFPEPNFSTTATSAFHNFRSFPFGRGVFAKFCDFAALESIIQRPPTIRTDRNVLERELRNFPVHNSWVAPSSAADDIFNVISSIIFCVQCPVAYFCHGSQTLDSLTFKRDSIFEIRGRTVIEILFLPFPSYPWLSLAFEAFNQRTTKNTATKQTCAFTCIRMTLLCVFLSSEHDWERRKKIIRSDGSQMMLGFCSETFLSPCWHKVHQTKRL